MAFADASFLIGLFDRKDQWHPRASASARSVRGTLKVTEIALGEAVTTIGARVGGTRARELYETALDACELIFTSGSLLDEAMEYHTRFDGRLSVSDCVMVAAMVASGDVEIFSFDSDFDRVKGITRRS